MSCRLPAGRTGKNCSPPLTLVFAGGILVLSLVWAASMLIQDRRALSHVQDQIRALAPAVRQVQDDEAVVQRLQAQLQTLRSETRIRLTPLLKDMSERIPQEIYLTNFQFRSGKVELTGVAQERLGLRSGRRPGSLALPARRGAQSAF